MVKVEIRRLESVEDLRRCEELQKRIWKMADIRVVPCHMLVAIRDCGGLILGAFLDKKIVGFAFSFPAIRDGRLVYWFAMMGVDPKHQLKGIGYKLSLRQREHALNQGANLMLWTSDPLRSVNAHLYLTKLGAICDRYLENYYGEMLDELNIGIPSDRFLNEWWIRSPRVLARLAKGRKLMLDDLLSAGARFALRADFEDELPIPTPYNLTLDADVVLIEIPSDFNQVRRTNLDVARAWRLATRRVFKSYFDRGYVATDLVSEIRGGVRRNFYALRRAAKNDILKATS